MDFENERILKLIFPDDTPGRFAAILVGID